MLLAPGRAATRQPGSRRSSSFKRRSPGMPSKRPFGGGARRARRFRKGPRREMPPASAACISLTSLQISSLQNLRSLGSSHLTPPEKGRVVMRAKRKRARRRWKRRNELSLTWCGSPLKTSIARCALSLCPCRQIKNWNDGSSLGFDCQAWECH